MLLRAESCRKAEPNPSACLTSAAATSNSTFIAAPHPQVSAQVGDTPPGVAGVAGQPSPTWVVMLRGITLEASVGAKPRVAAAHVTKEVDGRARFCVAHNCADALTSWQA